MTSVQIYTLWHEYYPKVYGYFYRRLDNRADVEDLTSITLAAFLDALQNESKTIRSQQAFLWKIAYNQLLLFIREKSKHPVSIVYDERFEAPDDEYDLRRNATLEQRFERLMRCVESHLETLDQLLINKVIMQDQKAIEVAKEIEMKPEAVRQRISRALKKLRLQCKQLWIYTD